MSEPVLSPADGAVFGFPVARAFIDTPDDLAGAERFCRDRAVRLLVARCHAGDVAAVHALTKNGHLLMATQTRYSCRVAIAARQWPDPRYPIRPAVDTDADALRELTRDSFAGYASHYHTDPRLDRALCDEVYVHWVLESLAAQRPDESLFVAERHGRLTGFGLFRVRDKVGEALLAGARPASDMSRAFVFRALLREGTRGAHAAGAVRAFTNTNIDNYVVHHVLIRASWMPVDAIHTFHWWLDE